MGIRAHARKANPNNPLSGDFMFRGKCGPIFMKYAINIENHFIFYRSPEKETFNFYFKNDCISAIPCFF